MPVLLVTYSADAGHTTFPRPSLAAWSTRLGRLKTVGQVASIEVTCGKAIRLNSATHLLAGVHRAMSLLSLLSKRIVVPSR